MLNKRSFRVTKTRTKSTGSFDESGGHLDEQISTATQFFRRFLFRFSVLSAEEACYHAALGEIVPTILPELNELAPNLELQCALS